jgi:hypothetical protein
MTFVSMPGAQQIQQNRRWHETRSYRRPGLPPVLVLHTVEGYAGEGQVAAHNHPPHLWMDPIREEIFQTVSLDRPALALQNPGGGIETNHRGLCFQIELQLFTDPARKDSPRHVTALTDSQLAWLGAQIKTLDIIAQQLDPLGRGFLPDTADNIRNFPNTDEGYGQQGAYRLTPEKWMAEGGIRGHVEVPGNAHYDPSGLDTQRIVEHALGRPQLVRKLRPGSKGWAVEELQKHLNDNHGQKLVEDGDFGPATTAAVRTVQALLGLPVTGTATIEELPATTPAPITFAPPAFTTQQTKDGHLAAAIVHAQSVVERLERLRQVGN